MKLYAVSLPIAGLVEVEVLAENEEAAITKALDETDFSKQDIEEWQAYRHLVQGNIAYPDLIDAKAKCIDENPEEE